MATLYENIKALCDEHGVKPSRMCKEAGASKSIVSMLKSGEKKYISLEVAKKIANYFNVSVDDVLVGTLQGNLDHELRGYRMGREEEKETPAAPKNDGLTGLSDFEKSVIEFLRSDRDFYAQTELGIEMAKRKIEIFFRI